MSLAASAENEVVPAWSQFEADVYGNVVDAKLFGHRQSTMYLKDLNSLNLLPD